MGTVIILIIILAIILLAVKSTIKRILYGSSCCGQKDRPEKKIKVQDKNKKHYPYKYQMKVDGMRCTNCARRIENTLNSIDGLWAKVSLENKLVTVLSKKEYEVNELSRKINEEGYSVLETL